MHIPNPRLSTKVATGLDVLGTLAVTQFSFLFNLPFWHPAIFSSAVGMTYALFRWKEEITAVLFSLTTTFKYSRQAAAETIEDCIVSAQHLFEHKNKRISTRFDEIGTVLQTTKIKAAALRNKNNYRFANN